MCKCKNCINLYNQSDENDKIVGKWCPKINDSPDVEIERDCKHYNAMTNGDKIRAMTDEELTKIIMCPYDTAGAEFEIMPCVKDGGIQEFVSPENAKSVVWNG